MDALVDWERRDRGAMRQSLDPMRDLVRRLGSPEAGTRVVHVAGTKGKGSVASLVGAGLGRAGLRVGVYASPHVERVNERVVIDGVAVGDERLAEGLERAWRAREEALAQGSPASRATWFDLMTAAGLWLFADSRLDWSVVEVGLGGRLDSTNVVRAQVCVITSIDLEHTAVLGGTRRAIALEKAGILEAGGVLVTGLRPIRGLDREDDAWAAIEEVARRLAVRVRVVEPPGAPTIVAINRALAGAVLDELGGLGHRDARGAPLTALHLDEQASLAARLPGRLERRRSAGTPVVLDGAHVASSLRLVLEELGCDPSLAGRPVAVLALGRDKDASAFLKALRGAADTVACTRVDGSRHRDPVQLADLARAQGLGAESFEDAAEALAWALERARGRWVLVTGSLWLVGALRSRTEQPEPTRC